MHHGKRDETGLCVAWHPSRNLLPAPRNPSLSWMFERIIRKDFGEPKKLIAENFKRKPKKRAKKRVKGGSSDPTFLTPSQPTWVVEVQSPNPRDPPPRPPEWLRHDPEELPLRGWRVPWRFYGALKSLFRTSSKINSEKSWKKGVGWEFWPPTLNVKVEGGALKISGDPPKPSSRENSKSKTTKNLLENGGGGGWELRHPLTEMGSRLNFFPCSQFFAVTII